MDYAEEQDMELQALEAIYGDDFKKLEGDGQPAFEVTLVPEAGAGEDVNHVSVAMKVVYSPTYPETAPTEVSLRVVRRGALTDELVSECQELLIEAAKSDECLGNAMVYLLAEKCIEWLVEHNQPEMDMHAQMMARLKKDQPQEDAVDVGDNDSKGRVDKKSNEAEGTWRKDADDAFDPAADAAARGETFTAITKENFAEFRKEWLAMRASAKAASATAQPTAGSGRNRDVATDGLTGRELFERNTALISTDAGALEDGEVDVMSAPRAAVDAPAAAAAGDGTASADTSGAGDGLLAAVGDEALFNEDEDLDDLPDDEDE